MKCSRIDCKDNKNYICKSNKKNKGVCWIAVNHTRNRNFDYYLRMYTLATTILLIATTIMMFNYRSKLKSIEIKNVFLKNDIEWFRQTNKSLIMDKELLSQPLYLEEVVIELKDNSKVMFKYGIELENQIENLEGLYNSIDEVEQDVSKLYQRTNMILERDD